ncbi:MAG TPA: hypothetical protein VE988_17800 [Gemmataceae bacterium]|nr:hypothetical protein [Gemmataceae bacterium]
MQNEFSNETQALMQLFRQIEEEILAAQQRHAMEGKYEIAERFLSLAKRTHALLEELQSFGAAEMQVPSITPNSQVVLADHGFPCFWVEGEMLRKMGLSRDRTNTYTHGIAKGQFAKVVVALKELATRQESFSVREFIKGCGMPDYHPYIVLGALEDLQLLRSPRRGLMTFVNAPEFGLAAEQAWGHLAKRPNPAM